MKEYIGHASNLSLLFVGEPDTLKPVVELIVVVAEPQFQIDPTGALVKMRTTETLRFSLGTHGLDALIEGLEEIRTAMQTLPLSKKEEK